MSLDVSISVGTRPEAIKCAPVVMALRARGLTVRLVAAGQHAELLDDALAAFELTPDVNLRAHDGAPGLAALSSRLLEKLDGELAAHRPALAMVQGDTATTLAGALAAFYQRVPCAHIEAGLRSGRMDAPWPEEMNRIVTTRLCARHYAPTAGARENLLREGVAESAVVVTGQTGVDAAQWMNQRLDGRTPPGLEKLPTGAKRLIYVTAHRRENQQGAIANILRGVAQALEADPGAFAVLAAHPSPSVQREVAQVSHERLLVIKPLDYMASVWMIANSAVIVSDSGGIQEEAPAFGTPVLITRDVTERPEGVAAGFNRLVGTDAGAIAAAIAESLADTGLRQKLLSSPNPYGNGDAARQIADDVARILKA